MKLIIPYVTELCVPDAHLMRLAEFLGVTYETVALPTTASDYAGYLRSVAPDGSACLAVNPSVMKQWLTDKSFGSELGAFLPQYFKYLLVHSPRPTRFDNEVVSSLSGGALKEVKEFQGPGNSFDVPWDSLEVTEAFAGLSVGTARWEKDHVYIEGRGPTARRLISVNGEAHMALVNLEKAAVYFVGSEDVADIHAEVNDNGPIAEFSRFMPHTMALRHIFGENCWRPSENHASVIVDDPLLHATYGFLNFGRLLLMMEEHNFHTTIAFIPHNFRRSSSRIASLFCDSRNGLALCYHGNDHTQAEFASTNVEELDLMIQTATQRMAVHRDLTGICANNVMVFPQGNFSVESMNALKAHNFDAAVNTVPHPRHQAVRLTLAEYMSPAVLRYAGFPLFLRKDSEHTQKADIAFNLFFGKPTFIVEHHGIFKNPQPLIEAVQRINDVAPEIIWSNVSNGTARSTLRRREADGRVTVQAFSRTVAISNRAKAREKFVIHWHRSGENDQIEGVLLDNAPWSDYRIERDGAHAELMIEPGATVEIAIKYKKKPATCAKIGFRKTSGAFVRRRLSEVRDNYLSKNTPLLSLAKTVRRQFQR